MPQTETKKSYEHLEKEKKTTSNVEQVNPQETDDSLNKNTKTGISPIEKPMKGRGERFLDSITGNGPFIKKALKGTAMGIGVGFALAMLFPPLGIAVMAISAIAGVATIGTKVAYNYAKTKDKNRDTKEIPDTNSETPDPDYTQKTKNAFVATEVFEKEVKSPLTRFNDKLDLHKFTTPIVKAEPKTALTAEALKQKQKDIKQENPKTKTRHISL